jgi:16S rRNA (guanine527-N7)-methyltransferase
MNFDENTQKKLKRYASLLAASNARARLTGPSDEPTIYEEHIKDALAALPLLEKFPARGRIADIGTGGGLPGIVWGICRPDLEFTLADSVGKKIDIVREIAENLELKNVTALKARSEELALSQREAFDAAAARAVASTPVLAEYLSPLVKVGGEIIMFKGSSAASEIDMPATEWKKLGLGTPHITPYSVAGKSLNFVIWEKISPCPRRFPRRPGEARKNPWR